MMRFAAVALGGLLIAGCANWWWQARESRGVVTLPPPRAAQVMLISTRKMFLPDGSRVELKAGAQVVPEFADRERRLRLAWGEAHFTVEKDPWRPFVVEAAGVEVRAVGTAFSVRRDAAGVEVVVNEGTVRVGGAKLDENGGRLLEAGRRGVVMLTDQANPGWQSGEIEHEELRQVQRWREMRLKFSNCPIAVAVKEFNHLNPVQMVVDLSAEELRVSATFLVDEVASFVTWLEQAHGVLVHRRADGTIVLRKAI